MNSNPNNYKPEVGRSWTLRLNNDHQPSDQNLLLDTNFPPNGNILTHTNFLTSTNYSMNTNQPTQVNQSPAYMSTPMLQPPGPQSSMPNSMSSLQGATSNLNIKQNEQQFTNR